MLRLTMIATVYNCTYCDSHIAARPKGAQAWIDDEKEEAFHLDCKEKMKEEERNRRVFYTTASERYDGFGTRTEAIVGKTDRGKDVRKVSIPHENIEWQITRYCSGLEGAWTQKEYDGQVTHGWILPAILSTNQE